MNLNKVDQDMDFDLTDFQLENNQAGRYAILMGCGDRILTLDSGPKQLMNKRLQSYDKIKPNGAILKIVDISNINFDIFAAAHGVLKNTFGMYFG